MDNTESTGSLDRAELARLLERGHRLTRQEAEGILQQGPELLPALLSVLHSGRFPSAWTAGVLLGALGDDRAASALGALLDSPRPELRSVAAESLGRLGGLEPLLRHQSEVPYEVHQALVQLACHHPELRSQVGQALEEVLRDRQASGPVRASAASCLQDLDWREALPYLAEAVLEPDWYSPGYGWQAVQAWQAGERSRPLPPSDPLQWLARPCRSALEGYLKELSQAIERQLPSPEFLARFQRDLQDLRPQALPASRAGRNAACPCGSGRRYKKCCLEADLALTRPGPLESRLQSLQWPPQGYRLTPREQLARLEPAEVLEHLDILRLATPARVRARLQGETRDYLLWAGAVRYRLLNRPEFVEVATTVALSDQDHPALNYYEISALCQASPQGGCNPIIRELPVAIQLAQRSYGEDPAEGLRAFQQLLQRHPQPLWTVAALAEAALTSNQPELALEPLDRALEAARRGHSRGHALLPDQPCPETVLSEYRQALDREASNWARLRSQERRWEEDPLAPEARRELYRLALEESRRAEETRRRLGQNLDQEAQILQQHAQACQPIWSQAARVYEDLLSRPDPRRRQPLLAAHRDRQLVWLVPDLPELVNQLRAALVQTAGELGRELPLLREGAWGSWRAVEVSWPDPQELIELLAVAVSEPLGVVGLEWQHALALGGGEPLLEPSPPEELPQPPGLRLEGYLRRVLTRLLRQGKVGAAHTDLGYFLRGLPPQGRGLLKETLDLLVLDGYIRVKPTVTGPHISLEPRRLGPIKSFVEEGVLPPGRLALYFERLA